MPTERFSPATYRCPRCRTAVSVFQLRTDAKGIPRRVNVQGSLCNACLRQQDDLEYRHLMV